MLLPRGPNNAGVVSAIAFLHGKVLFLRAYPDFRMQTGSGQAVPIRTHISFAILFYLKRFCGTKHIR